MQKHVFSSLHFLGPVSHCFNKMSARAYTWFAFLTAATLFGAGAFESSVAPAQVDRSAQGTLTITVPFDPGSGIFSVDLPQKIDQSSKQTGLLKLPLDSPVLDLVTYPVIELGTPHFKDGQSRVIFVEIRIVEQLKHSVATILGPVTNPATLRLSHELTPSPVARLEPFRLTALSKSAPLYAAGMWVIPKTSVQRLDSSLDLPFHFHTLPTEPAPFLLGPIVKAATSDGVIQARNGQNVVARRNKPTNAPHIGRLTNPMRLGHAAPSTAFARLKWDNSDWLLQKALVCEFGTTRFFAITNIAAVSVQRLCPTEPGNAQSKWAKGGVFSCVGTSLVANFSDGAPG